MTLIVDLPNEILLLIAESLDTTDRRNFSKTCTRIFRLIRNQSNEKRYGIRKKGLYIVVHQLNVHHFIMRIGAEKSKKKYEKDEGRKRKRNWETSAWSLWKEDVREPKQVYRVFSISSNLYTVPDRTNSMLRTYENNTEQVRCPDALTKTLALIKEANSHFDIEFGSYAAHSGILNMQFVRLFWKLFKRCHLTVGDHYVTEEVEEVYGECMREYLEDMKITNRNQCRELTMSDQMKTPGFMGLRQKLAEMDASSHRLLNNLRTICDERSYIDDCEPCDQYNGERIMSVHVLNETNQIHAHIDYWTKFGSSLSLSPAPSYLVSEFSRFVLKYEEFWRSFEAETRPPRIIF